MEFLHLWRGDELFERGWSLDLSENNQPLTDPRQITFVTFNGFWPLCKNPLTSLFWTDNIKLDGMPTKIKWKIQACFTLYSKFWEYTCVKSYKIQLRVLLFLVLHQFLYKQISFFTTFKNFTEHYLKKIFLPNLTDSSKSPTPLMARQVFSSIFPKKPSEIFFFKNLLAKSCKSIFYVSAVNCYCTYTLNRYPGLLFRKSCKNGCFHASISN